MRNAQPLPILDRLRQDRVRLTGPRLAVLSLLEKEHHLLSAKEVWKKLPPPKSDLVSVYRIMDRFEKEGIVIRIRLGDNTTRYELKRDHHHHVCCTVCGKIAEVHLCVKDIERKVLRETGFQVTFHDFQLSGFCAACAKQAKRSRKAFNLHAHPR